MDCESEIQILLIEDNPDEAELEQAMLLSVRQAAFCVTHVTSLAEGTALLEAQSGARFDLVLLDLNLPDSGGYETFARLHQRAGRVPVIVMTGVADEALALQALRQGAQDYLVKTQIERDALARSIRYAIERKRVEEALRESEERYFLAIQGANDGLWDWNIETNQIYFSPRWKAMLGCEENEIGNDPEDWFARVHPEDSEIVRANLKAHLEGESLHFECEYRILNKNENYQWVLSRGLAVRDERGRAYRMAGSQTDITRRKRTEEQLQFDALHDALTGLPNRMLFNDRLGRIVLHARRHPGYRYAVLCMDLDRFKVINDSLGHSFGDQVLVAIAGVLNECLRSGDSVARLGGDEFVILLDDISRAADAVNVAERIQRMLQSPFNYAGKQVVASASIGVVVCDGRYEKPDDILRDADIAMYQAKVQGKACHAVFTPLMRERAITRMALENDLRRALESEERMKAEMVVHFQPIICLKSGRITGFEALLRWMHPERGLVKPNGFIPVAEETGLIHALGLWVLREACEQLHSWQESFPSPSGVTPLKVNVNISGKQFTRPELVEQIQHIVQESGIHPATLCLEITESWLMESERPLRDVLQKLRSLQVQLEVDDFGRGYSSFRYLQSLPVNTLKIDRLFIRRLGANGGDNSEIVRSIVGLARSLGMSVIAEGVETEAQLKKLRELDCPYVQGFYFSEPLTPADTVDLLQQSRYMGQAQYRM